MLAGLMRGTLARTFQFWINVEPRATLLAPSLTSLPPQCSTHALPGDDKHSDTVGQPIMDGGAPSALTGLLLAI
jgi:hypothetical protein